MITRRGLLSTAAASAAMAATRPTKDAISLAAWSINRSFFVAHRWKNLDLPKICREEFGVDGIEFVNQFFDNPTLRSLQQLKRAGDDYGVNFVLIMCDGEGDMAAADKAERMTAAVMHRKWVDAGHYLGCHAIRCNLGGPRGDWQQDTGLVKRAAESFRDLLDYAKGSGLNVVIENHGRASSDPDVLVPLMKEVDDPDFGVLPDFGNVNPGADHEEVIRKLVPYAKGISVKAAWETDGTHQRWNLERLLKICQDAGYHGFWGIESSYGNTRDRNLSHDQIWEMEKKGVMLTKQVIERVIFNKS
ncbi:MAG: sugar phosphate isomerase/epimerase [bacterium]|nr:sugar phosphate isomerase/epimerase [bacterium]